jgi:hypothetical protein
MHLCAVNLNVRRDVGTKLTNGNEVHVESRRGTHFGNVCIANFNYWCQTLFLSLREENKLHLPFGNKIRKIFGPTRSEVTEQFSVI